MPSKTPRKPARTYEGKLCIHAPEAHGRTRYASSKACVGCTLERAVDQGSRPYVRKADRAPGRRTVRADAVTPPSSAPHALQLEALQLAPNAGPHDLGESLAHAMTAAGLAHIALTMLDSGLWQCVTLQPGYRDQVTRTGLSAGEALTKALGAKRGRSDELLDVVG